MKLFVTGGTGFIGSHFLREAVRRGHQVVALRRSASATAECAIEWVDGDLESCPQHAFTGCDVFVHLGAHGVTTSAADWEGCFRWNVHASLALLLAACEAGVRRFLVCGSCFEYGRSAERFEAIPPSAPLLPIGPYAASKAAATMWRRSASPNSAESRCSSSGHFTSTAMASPPCVFGARSTTPRRRVKIFQ